MLNLVHALVLTPYEATLPAQSIEELLQQDYPRHIIYDEATGKEILSGFSYENSFVEQLAVVSNLLELCKEFTTCCYKKIVRPCEQENDPKRFGGANPFG